MKVSDIVLSLRGHDAGNHMVVLAVEGEFLFLADGKRRRAEKPKRKKQKHVELAAESDSRVALKLRAGEKVTNNELRRALADFIAQRAQSEADPNQ
ncbi:MAG: KOW domain-containing RNA-binding protein [Oscillospiraceae bacterium]|jgi:ribosomal protein L14E/L6E/L27E|nr:KOW domain-containing RNA-binding protein [Oscillospiraceae bacterium]